MSVEQRFIEIDDPDGTTHWRLDAGFLNSYWTCIWGAGCQGIHDEKRPELMDGCCSVGVVLQSDDEAMTITALAATIPDELFQFGAERSGIGVLERRGANWATRVVDGACVLLNRPGFAKGPGCALHLAAVSEGEDPLDWKPTTCSRVPLHADERKLPDGGVEVTVRVWRRDDWGPGGATMAWWCTDAPEAYIADTPLHERMSGELSDLLGTEVLALARRRLDATSEAGAAD
jgi:hypothetical protein